MPRAITLTDSKLSSASFERRPARSSGTVERILEGALELFNRDDGGSVSTNHIAAHLGMSPGNLYYHFRNREEIVRALFPPLVEAGLSATAPARRPTFGAREFGERHIAGMEILWRFRFFYRDLNQLVARDPLLAADYRAYYGRLRAQYAALFEHLVRQGSMRKPSPAADLQRLVTDSIVLWFNWIPFLTASRPRPEIGREDVAEGALHSFLVVAPHLEPRFAATARGVILRHAKL